MNYSSIRDNHSHGTVGDFLKEKIVAGSDFSVVSAYFTVFAFAALKEQLNDIGHLKFLFGEPTFISSVGDSEPNQRGYKIEDDTLTVTTEKRLLQKQIARECADWLRNKAEVRSMVKPNFLHGKLYHVHQPNGVEAAVVGSSNFTVNGLGLGGSKNMELNMVIDSDRDRRELKDWFEQLWNDQTGLVEDVKDHVLGYLEMLYAENSPEFVYYKTLFHLFDAFLDDSGKSGLLNEKTGFFDSEIWKSLYDFQKDGVKGAINKILRYNGCIIADSVGLGKTYEALAVIKYFELLNLRVLVICPKKLKGNWTIYQATQNHLLNPFVDDRFGYTVVYHTDLGRMTGVSDANGINLETFHWGAYDLVVIDESHNFRGDALEKKLESGERRMNRAMWLMSKIIREGVKTRVLLLSATPVNNTLQDLRNQIAYITEGQDDALLESSQVRSIGQTLKTAQKQFLAWADRSNPQRTLQQLMTRLDSAFFKVLDDLTIARSRKHIKTFYKLDGMGSFPSRGKPISVYPEIDSSHRFPSYDKLNRQIMDYKLAVFNPSAYILPQHQVKYEAMAGGNNLNFTQKGRESTLVSMMKVNFLKRLESSIYSFERSLERTIQKIEALEDLLVRYESQGVPLAEVETVTPEADDFEEDSEELDAWTVGKRLKIELADLDRQAWLVDLQADKDALIMLHSVALSVTPPQDAKLAELKGLILKKVQQPTNEGNHKVLVFTAFSDTAHYLYREVQKWYQETTGRHVALICGSDTKTTLGRNDYDSILTNFSPRSKRRSQLPKAIQDGEIDLLIATDCISEGQNLQDCDLLINYDIHWNPVRIIQRFGRIDRLGSVNKVLQLVNFWPTRDLDNYINLKERVEARMALVDMTATGEDNILNTEQIQELIADDLKYRNNQLKRLRDEVLDLEDMDSSVSLTDFTLDDFRMELLRYLEAHKKVLDGAPMGLYAVVPVPAPGEVTESERAIIQPGVVFCLRQLKDTGETQDVNPLAPYYLVYIRQDGTVRFQFTQAKQSLEVFRLLCQGKTAPYEALCQLFNNETNQGKDMEPYVELLRKASQEVLRVYEKRGAQALVRGGRKAVLAPPISLGGEIPFELITWLIIR